MSRIVFFYSSQFDKVDQKTHNSVLMRAAEPRVVEDSGWLCSQITAHSFIFAPTSLYKTTAWVWPTLNRRGRIAISVFTGGYNTNEHLSLQSVSDWKQTGVEERGETVHDLINRGWHFSDNNNSKVKHSESVHRVDINPGRSAQVKSTCGKHCIIKTLLITHCDGYIIMTPSVFKWFSLNLTFTLQFCLPPSTKSRKIIAQWSIRHHGTTSIWFYISTID